MGLTLETLSIRPYGSFAEIKKMISRTAFNQLRHSAILLSGTFLGMFFTYLLPVVLLFTAKTVPVLLGALACGLMGAGYRPTVKFYERSALWALALPAIASFYLWATWVSAWQYWSGRGGKWKGRVQDARVR